MFVQYKYLSAEHWSGLGKLVVVPSTKATTMFTVQPWFHEGTWARNFLKETLLIFIGSNQAESKIFIPYLAKAKHWKSMWHKDSSLCPHFLHTALYRRRITYGCHLSIQQIWRSSCTAVITIKNYWVSGHCPSSRILNTRKHNVLGTLQLLGSWTVYIIQNSKY
jgi:hypothetical protein